jgi:hypothetical protein
MFSLLNRLNESKLLAGLAMLILNIGSKYIEFSFSKTQEEYIKYILGRELVIFTIIFVGTHDIIISILMTAAFIILSDTVFNERSKYCLMTPKFKKLHKLLDTNKDGYISDKEIEKAQDILYKANIQKNKLNQLNNLNYFNNSII